MAFRVKAGQKYSGAIFYPAIFGGFALIDFDKTGFIIMSILEVIAIALCFVLIGFLILPFVHIASILWALAVVKRNRERADAKRASGKANA